MGEKKGKTKFSIRVDTELLALADAYVKESTIQSRTEFIEEAIRFYLGFFDDQKIRGLFVTITIVRFDWNDTR